MKKVFLLFFTVCLLLLATDAFSLTGSLSYSDFGRNSSYSIVTNTTLNTVNVKIYNSAISSYIYEENFSSVAVDEFGLFAVKIGTGTVVYGTWAGVTSTPGMYVMIMTKLNSGDPLQAIQSISLQTLAYETEIPTGAVTSSDILDGSIVDADISGSAGITVTKIAGGTDGQGLKMTGTTVAWGTDTTVGLTPVFGELYLPYSSTPDVEAFIANTYETATSITFPNYTSGYTSGSVTVSPSTGLITVPSAGYYRVSIQSSFLINNNGEYYVLARVTVNGTASTRLGVTQYSDASPRRGNMISTGILNLSANDQIALQMTMSVTDDANFYFISFRVERIQ